MPATRYKYRYNFMLRLNRDSIICNVRRFNYNFNVAFSTHSQREPMNLKDVIGADGHLRFLFAKPSFAFRSGHQGSAWVEFTT